MIRIIGELLKGSGTARKGPQRGKGRSYRQPKVYSDQYQRPIVARRSRPQTVSVETMLITILIFVLSFAATLQFAVMSWRARLLRFTAQAFEGQVYVATANMLTDKSFGDVAGYQQFCPSLDAYEGSKLSAVKLYHGFLKTIGSPDWAKGEMALCAQYASAVLLQRVQRNQVLAAEVCSY